MVEKMPTAREILSSFRSGELSPVEVVSDALHRIDRYNPTINAFCHVDREGAMAAAQAAEARWMRGAAQGPLDGLPIGVKDNLLVAGMPARFGSRLTGEAPAQVDAPAVARLREAGAIVLGKTTTPEFGWKAVTDSPLTGITRNPWNTAMTPGGSSGGAVAALMLGMGAVHLGTDGGGSIRIPASFTGCFGIKPSRPRVPFWPPSPLGTLAHVGPLTTSVADAALVLGLIAQPDRRDPHAWISEPGHYSSQIDDGVAGLRIAYSPRLGYAKHVESEVDAAVSSAVRLLESAGAHVEEADPDMGGDPIAIWEALWWSSAASILDSHGERASALADPGLVASAERGKSARGMDVVRAHVARAELSIRMAQFHERYDLLVTPTMPLAAFEAGHLMPPQGGWGDNWFEWSPFSYPFNLTMQPAASVPVGLTSTGLPIGLQVVGPVGSDMAVLRACHAIEQARPFDRLQADPGLA